MQARCRWLTPFCIQHGTWQQLPMATENFPVYNAFHMLLGFYRTFRALANAELANRLSHCTVVIWTSESFFCELSQPDSEQ